jgi:hypothetical protein
MASDWQVIHLQTGAPAKPAVGAPCNGCGVCCAAEPCPLGILLSGRRHGSCDALRWDDSGSRYNCGAVSAPATVLPVPLRPLAPLLGRLARRWISAGSGCDSTLTPHQEGGPAPP